jgi:peptide chain release factor subunit 1
MNNEEEDADRAVEVHRMKRLIKGLTAARGHGTSMVSLIIPPKDQISRVVKMLADEFGTASNIKSRVNRQSVLSAITSTQQRLKLYSKVPPNGLVIYCGTIVTENNKEKEVTIDLEPFKPINTSLVRRRSPYYHYTRLHRAITPLMFQFCSRPRCANNQRCARRRCHH